MFALEGDGSLLMQLGALATVAAAKRKNLAIVVWDNGVYQITGAQKTLTSKGADLVGIAKGAGLAQSAWAADETHFEALVERALSADGPWLIAARTDDKKPAGTTERDPAKIRLRFMRGWVRRAESRGARNRRSPEARRTADLDKRISR